MFYTGKIPTNQNENQLNTNTNKIGDILENASLEDSKEQSYHFYSESIANGEIRGFCKKHENVIEEWKSPCLLVSKIQYGMESEYKSHFRLWPKVSENSDNMGNKHFELLSVTDFNDYFKSSDQIYTQVSLNIKQDKNSENTSIVGLLVQKMPGVENDNYVDLIYNLITDSDYFQSLIRGEDNLDAIKFKEVVQSKFDINLTRYPLDFYCRCDKPNMFKILKSVSGKLDLIQHAKEHENQLNTSCHYCNKKYSFTSEDLEETQSESSQ